uniref:thioredoxin domain-containing protein 15 n=1 Tax=Myxine glutinosa TaxID=7769 RepID=UPI00358ED34F
MVLVVIWVPVWLLCVLPAVTGNGEGVPVDAKDFLMPSADTLINVDTGSIYDKDEVLDIEDGEEEEKEEEEEELGLTVIPVSSSKEIITGLEPKQKGNETESRRPPKKVNCTLEELDEGGGQIEVLQYSQDLLEMLGANSTSCALVLFYAPWCRFSLMLAPHFHALSRAFPCLHYFALDAAQHSSLATRFGTVAVPNVLLFQGAKPIARFNHSERSLETLSTFIYNHTGLLADPSVMVTDADLEGPLPTSAQPGPDWALVFSITFLLAFSLYMVLGRGGRAIEILRLARHPHQD